MVRVAIAGGSGQVAREVIDALLETREHDITILSRNDAPENMTPGTGWCRVDYNNHLGLVEALRGIDTLLSFVQLLSDPESKSQKHLIDAAIAAGVKRFSPSEYGSAGMVNMPWYSGKEATRDYLRTVNAKEDVLEYTLFQPGLFLDYLAFPHKTAKYLDPLQSVFDYQHCRAILVDGHEDAIITLTTVADVAAVVARAVGYDSPWPKVGGIRGARLTFSRIVEIGERIRGRRFTIDRVNSADLEDGVLETSWALEKRHAAVPEEQHAELVKTVTIGMLLSSMKGAWDVTSELNQIFPDHEFAQVEDFLARVWNAESH